jgi:hypothetical protein
MNLLGNLAGILLVAYAQGTVAQSVVGGSPAAGGATYRCVDNAGRSTYTNVQEEMAGKKCTVVIREVSVVPVPKPAVPSAAQPSASRTDAKPEAKPPANRVDPQTQRARDNDRRRILQDELANAEKALAAARQKLAEQESIRTGDEKNYQRVLDRLKPFQDDVRGAEANVAALKRELGNLR